MTGIQHDRASDQRDHPIILLDKVVIERGNLTPMELALYVVILYFVNNKTNIAFPSMEVLAERAGMSKRSVVRHIAALEEKGLIRTIRNSTRGNHYLVLNPHTAVSIGATESPVGVTESPISATESPSPDAPLVPESHQVVAGVSATESPSGAGLEPESHQLVSQSHQLVPESHQLVPQSHSNNNVVVDPDPESDTGDQQQQRREPTPAEADIFRELHISPEIFTAWMKHEAEHVLACALHARALGNNPVGLLRAMLEQGKGAPNPQYVKQAQRQLGSETGPDWSMVIYTGLDEPDDAPEPTPHSPGPQLEPTPPMREEPGPGESVVDRSVLDTLPDSRMSPSDVWDVVRNALGTRSPSLKEFARRAEAARYSDGVLTVRAGHGSVQMLSRVLHVLSQDARRYSGGVIQRIEFEIDDPRAAAEYAELMRKAAAKAAQLEAQAGSGAG